MTSLIVHHSIDDQHDPNSQQHGSNASSTSFLPSRGATEAEAIRSTIDGTDPLEWPTADSTTLINEFKTAGLATMAFPTLFPYGKGDPMCPSRQHPVTLNEAFKHLNRYGEVVDGENHWHFASHPRFPYWSLNMKIWQSADFTIKSLHTATSSWCWSNGGG